MALKRRLVSVFRVINSDQAELETAFSKVLVACCQMGLLLLFFSSMPGWPVTVMMNGTYDISLAPSLSAVKYDI